MRCLTRWHIEECQGAFEVECHIHYDDQYGINVSNTRCQDNEHIHICRFVFQCSVSIHVEVSTTDDLRMRAKKGDQLLRIVIRSYLDRSSKKKHHKILQRETTSNLRGASMIIPVEHEHKHQDHGWYAEKSSQNKRISPSSSKQ